jgi:hypothetical protein
MRLSVLFPQQLQCQVLVGLELALDFSKVNAVAHGPRRLVGPGWKQEQVEPLIIAILRQGPVQPSSGRSFQVAMNGRLAYGATAGDLVLIETESVPQT